MVEYSLSKARAIGRDQQVLKSVCPPTVIGRLVEKWQRFMQIWMFFNSQWAENRKHAQCSHWVKSAASQDSRMENKMCF